MSKTKRILHALIATQIFFSPFAALAVTPLSSASPAQTVVPINNASPSIIPIRSNASSAPLVNASPTVTASKSNKSELDEKFESINSASSSGDMIDVEADNLSYQGDIAYADGDVVISYKDVTIKTASAIVDQKEKTAFGQDKFDMSYVGESGGKESITGEKLDYNFKTKVGSFDNSMLVQNAANPKHKLYIIAGKLTSENRKTYKFDNSYITTCRYFEDGRHEHYHLWAGAGWYTPKKQMVLFNVVTYIGSTPVFYTPIWYISLRKRQYIKIGTNKFEGDFVKSGIEYEWDDNNYGLVLNDNMSIKGWGSGLDHTYTDNKNTTLNAMFWQLHEQDTGLNSYKYKIGYTTKFGDNISNNLSISDNNTYTLWYGSRDDRASYSDSWSYSEKQTSLALGYNQSISNKSTNPVSYYNDTLNFTTPVASMTTLAMSGNHNFDTLSQQSTISNSNTLTNSQPWGTVSITNIRFYDLTASAAALYLGRSFVDRDSLSATYNQLKIDDRVITNSATFSSISDKVGGKQPVMGKALYYDMSIGARPIYIFGVQQLSFDIAGSGWKQALYDTGDAQYSIVENYSLTNRLSQAFTLTTTYNKEDTSPLNNTPFISADRLYGRGYGNNSLRSTMTIASSSGDFNYSWTTTGGFNYLVNLPDPVTHNLSFNIGKRQNYSIQFGSDPRGMTNRPLTFSGSVRSNDTGMLSEFGEEKLESAWTFGFNGTVDIDKTFTGNTFALTNISNDLTYDYGSSWVDHIRISYKGSYDMYSKLYKINSISIIKDIHDLQLSISYQPLGETYMFELKSIAFPQGSISATSSPQFGTSYGIGGLDISR